MADQVVLAYSGGLDTSVILKWLVETYGLDVIAFCADIGQGPDELEGLEQKARASGAAQVVIRDLREEFARDYVFPIIKAAAVYEGAYLLGTAIARPLIAKGQVETARELGAAYVSHGATGKGNDQVRFELTYRALAPDLKIIAPWRDPKWTITGRLDAMEYARRHAIPIKHTPEKPWSTDRNLLHISYESGILEDPALEPPADMFTLTVSPQAAPDAPSVIEIEFERGAAVAVDGERLSPAVLVERLNQIGGRNGIGRVDLVENRFVGMKSRGVYETPGGTLLHAAHRAVESITMDRDLLHLRDLLMPYYAERVYYGFWFSPEMRALNAFMETAQKNVTGTARLQLYKGNVTVLGRRSPVSLYDEQLATMDADQGAYDQGLATGFIQLNALRLIAQARLAGADDR